MKRCGLRSARAQRGLAMIELALTLPLLVLLMLAFAEFGRMLFQYNSLQQASRDAGRYVASQAMNTTLGTVVLSSTLISQTQNVAVYGIPSNPNGYPAVVPGLTTGNVTVSAVGTDHVQVSIAYTFVPVIASALPALYGSSVPLGLSLTSTVVMRAL
ncbi:MULTISPECIES: TadE/TadG family type IV pilus assembly protein [Pseudomonas]|jgi:Flp pilus assembly protein TadG|uniref:TadE/TadG family type IV pilus assembly protein n=1 Tax=Pseudomonas TaxID=286 RepID=UPI000BA2B47B|nr:MULTISPECIES: TadE/TadG family type IV pilus assembly protein [Pseudomonas]AOA06111.1 pilus assembly protein TadG [Pseudomonas sp. TMW 2.1634]PAA28433.1 pilus assembly protein TadG [Pseudomonas fragi]